MNTAKVINVNEDGSINAAIYKSAIKTNIVRILPLTQNIRIPYVDELVYVVKSVSPTSTKLKTQYQFYYLTPILAYNRPNKNSINVGQVTTKIPLISSSDDNISSDKTIILEKKEGDFFTQGANNQILKMYGDNTQLLLSTNSQITNSILNFSELDNILVMSSDDDDIDIRLSTSTFKNYSKSTPYFENGFIGNQIVLQSDNILLDSKVSSIVLSSNTNVHVVSNDFVGVEANNTVQLHSNEINLGTQSLEPAVLGDTLKSILNDMLSIQTQIISVINTFGLVLPPDVYLSLQSIKLDKLPNLLSKVVNISKNNILTLEYPDIYSVAAGTIPPQHLIYSEEYIESSGTDVHSIPLTNGLSIPSTDENIIVDNSTIEIEFQNLNEYKSLGNFDTFVRGQKTGTVNCYLIQGRPVASTIAPIVLQILKDAKKDGVNLILTSAFRTNEDIYDNGVRIASGQVTLRRKHALPGANIYTSSSKKFKPRTAPPGYSKHQNGIAIDLSTKGGGRYKWMVDNLNKYGFVRTVKSERWHWEYRPGTNKYQFVPQNHYTWDGF